MKNLILIAMVLFGLGAHAEIYQGRILGDVEFQTKRVAAPISEWKTPNFSEAEKDQILKQFDHLDPRRLVPTAALESALLFFEANRVRIPNKNYITVIDFSKHSGKKRFFLVNLVNGAVEALHAAHGKGSDSNHDGYAEKFSNVDGSLASSLGFYLTAEKYNGSNGLSMRLDGLSKTNSNARSRAIVVHGASYVNPNSSKMGRSWGCPALPTNVNQRVIEQIRNGSLMFGWIPGVTR